MDNNWRFLLSAVKIPPRLTIGPQSRQGVVARIGSLYPHPGISFLRRPEGMVPLFQHQIQGFIVRHNASACVIYQDRKVSIPAPDGYSSVVLFQSRCYGYIWYVGCIWDGNERIRRSGCFIQCFIGFLFYLADTSCRRNESDSDDRGDKYDIFISGIHRNVLRGFLFRSGISNPCVVLL